MLDAEALTPSPETLVASPTQTPIAVVLLPHSTRTPIPEIPSITPTPAIAEVSPVEEVPTSEPTPEAGAESVVPTASPERLQDELGSEVVPTTTPYVEADSTPTTTFARLMSPTPISTPEQDPKIEESDPPLGNITLPAYLGIAIGMFFVLVGGAAYVYRFRLALYLESTAYGRLLSSILTYRAFGYIRYRWESATSEWESARKYHREAMDRYIDDNQEEGLREAEIRHEKAFERLRRAFAEDINSLASQSGRKRRRPK